MTAKLSEPMKIAALRWPFVFALTGAVQGWVLWWLWNAQTTGQWPTTQPMVQSALWYAVMATPLAIYCTQGVDGLGRVLRRWAVLGYLLGYAGLGAYVSWASGADGHALAVRPQDVLAACALGFASLGLLCGFDFEARRWRYVRLFHYSWRNGIVLLTAGAMTGTVWLVLYAGAGLMKLIQVDWMYLLIQKPIFIFPVSALVVAAAMALGIARAAMTESVRRFWLSISAWLLPLVLCFSVVWVMAVPLTTLDPLFKTGNAALMLLWFTALAVKFANCAYQDGDVALAYPAWLGKAIQAAWVSLLPIVGIAWWALALRVEQHGWSEQRLWAALVALLAVIYALGYAMSWLQPGRWMGAIARTNIVAAVVLCLGLLAFLTPLANIQRLAVNAHIRHVLAKDSTTTPDWAYLRWSSGRFGQEALRMMAAGGVPTPEWAQQARAVLAQKSRYQDAPLLLSDAAVAQKIVVHPPGRQLPATFVADVKAAEEPTLKACVKMQKPCDVWLGDLNGDGVEELVLFHPEGYWGHTLFVNVQGKWQAQGQLSPAKPKKERVTPAELDSARTAPPEWQDLLLGGTRWHVQR